MKRRSLLFVAFSRRGVFGCLSVAALGVAIGSKCLFVSLFVPHVGGLDLLGGKMNIHTGWDGLVERDGQQSSIHTRSAHFEIYVYAGEYYGYFETFTWDPHHGMIRFGLTWHAILLFSGCCAVFSVWGRRKLAEYAVACEHCGYDLRDSSEAVCPECGTKIRTGNANG